MAHTGRLRPKRDLFPGVCIVYERVGISPVKVQERVGKSTFSVCKKAQRIKDAFMSVQRQGYVIYSYFKNSAFTAVKRGTKSQLQVGM